LRPTEDICYPNRRPGVTFWVEHFFKEATMKSFICSMGLICALSCGTLFAQGRGGGPAGGGAGAGIGGTRGDVGRPTASDNGNRQTPSPDRTANPKADVKKAEGTREPSQQLADNSKLSSEVAKLFPQGTDVSAKASGFKNLGQFVAAAHVSQNLNIPFDQLKAKMVSDGSSMGDAIHALKPELSDKVVKDETKKAEGQAKKDTNAKG
jgi:hypothetical protein